MWRKRNPHALSVEMQTGTAIVENSMEVPQKLKIEISRDPVILPLFTKENENINLEGSYAHHYNTNT